ncbi:MAG: DNA-binding response regulator [Chloroflexota bacterium]|nr:MAG: DNA-binding response regulator [Chloroflexota bacterium]
MNVLIVDDHLLFRDGLVSLFKSRPDYNVAGEAGSVKEALEKARSLKPDLILMDFSLPDGTGLDATRAILSEMPACKIVILTISDDDETLFDSIRCGAAGYVLKNVSVTSLFTDLEAIGRGEFGLSRALASRIIREFARSEGRDKPTASGLDQLSPRELEILRELTSGATNDEIAEQLCLSSNTVKHHIHSIFSKLGLANRREAMRYANEYGLNSRVMG